MTTRRIRRSLLGATSILMLSCAGPTGGTEPRTFVAYFDRVPTTTDIEELENVGALEVRALRLANALWFLGVRRVERYGGLAGPDSVADLGEDPDPVVSVFIAVSGEPTVDELELVRQLSSNQRADVVRDRNVISAIMRLSSVAELDNIERFLAVEISSNTNTTL